eukprot:1700819-Rhodomonas_salina.2
MIVRRSSWIDLAEPRRAIFASPEGKDLTNPTVVKTRYGTLNCFFWSPAPRVAGQLARESGWTQNNSGAASKFEPDHDLDQAWELRLRVESPWAITAAAS